MGLPYVSARFAEVAKDAIALVCFRLLDASLVSAVDARQRSCRPAVFVRLGLVVAAHQPQHRTKALVVNIGAYRRRVAVLTSERVELERPT
jgi:hypothetical protein